MSAMRVPKWRATSKVKPGSGNLKSHGTMIKWAELEMGRNSDKPCTAPKSTACQSVIGKILVLKIGWEERFFESKSVFRRIVAFRFRGGGGRLRRGRHCAHGR